MTKNTFYLLIMSAVLISCKSDLDESDSLSRLGSEHTAIYANYNLVMEAVYAKIKNTPTNEISRPAIEIYAQFRDCSVSSDSRKLALSGSRCPVKFEENFNQNSRNSSLSILAANLARGLDILDATHHHSKTEEKTSFMTRLNESKNLDLNTFRGNRLSHSETFYSEERSTPVYTNANATYKICLKSQGNQCFEANLNVSLARAPDDIKARDIKCYIGSSETSCLDLQNRMGNMNVFIKTSKNSIAIVD